MYKVSSPLYFYLFSCLYKYTQRLQENEEIKLTTTIIENENEAGKIIRVKVCPTFLRFLYNIMVVSVMTNESFFRLDHLTNGSIVLFKI